ncbi:Eukaryotic translation initiation factor 4E transporter [Merluccius polli]|uniref:Eukaryotic translation initiation factor 4E transporter n=1 Tax=Merluccius polli TaxID=89951 RepID=A0AA47MTW7_MERPO|nr:Eukaryotic translation initiation factor 4E transporter [Merluccius polli]
MELEACAEKICDVAVEKVKEPPVATSPYRYTKEELLEIKELPCSNERPECLADKYDSDGVWDPEKWHASLYPTSERSSPVEGFKKDYLDDRVPLKRRIPDPRERLKEDDLDVVLSPQRRSFGGGCQGNAAPAPLTRRPISPLENKENESLRLGVVRRIGSGRIIPARAFEREARMERERERDFKDKRFRRDFGDKRVFSERRRNDSYAEEEPEWFSGGPTSQSETIELIGFDDKILEDDKRRSKRSRRQCNGLAEEPDVVRDSTADQEVPHPEVLPEQSVGDFDFNEFFNLEKTMPGLASMIEDVLGEGPVSASRFSQWFSTNLSPSGSRSSSLRSTPHEELERLAGLEPHCSSPSHGPAPYFTPIPSSDRKEKVDILELLNKAKIDLKPLLSTLTVNKARLRESSGCPFIDNYQFQIEKCQVPQLFDCCLSCYEFCGLKVFIECFTDFPAHSGVVLSLEEVEGGMKGMKLQSGPQPRRVPQQASGDGTPFMAEHLEEALTGGSSARPRSRDPDMSAFNKLVSSMQASGTLPTHAKGSTNNHPSDPAVVSMSEVQPPSQQQKNIFHELLGDQCPPRSSSPTLLGGLLRSDAPNSAPLHGLLQKGPSPHLFPQRAPSPDYFHGHLQPPTGKFVDGFPVGPQSLLADQFTDLHRSISPGPTSQQQMRALSMAVSQISASFTPTSVIRKMYETKEKTRDEPGSRPDGKETIHSQDDGSSLNSCLETMSRSGSQPAGVKAGSQNLSSKDNERLRPGSASHHAPPMVSSGPGAAFSRPMYPVPLLSHLPMVRPPPPQLHPSVVQRMLAQGIQPQQLGPNLQQSGIFPTHVDLAQLQGLPPALLGPPLYPLGATGHPLLPPRANAQMQLAVMQQQLQQQRPVHPGAGVSQSQNHGPHRTNSQRHDGSPPLGLAKWFGSDVLQQPLPSMPAKVISVDELEFRP